MNKKLTGTIGEQRFTALITDPDSDGDVIWQIEFDEMYGEMEPIEDFQDSAAAEKDLRSVLERFGAKIDE